MLNSTYKTKSKNIVIKRIFMNYETCKKIDTEIIRIIINYVQHNIPVKLTIISNILYR